MQIMTFGLNNLHRALIWRQMTQLLRLKRMDLTNLSRACTVPWWTTWISRKAMMQLRLVAFPGPEFTPWMREERQIKKSKGTQPVTNQPHFSSLTQESKERWWRQVKVSGKLIRVVNTFIKGTTSSTRPQRRSTFIELAKKKLISSLNFTSLNTKLSK